jgi:hypothetical protein
MQLSAVPEIGIVKFRFKSSINYNFKQKLIGLLNFQVKSIFNFCFVIPIFNPYGKCIFTPILATSSMNWHFKLQFSYPSFIILKLEVVSISRGTTGMITYLLLKNMFGNDALPFKITSTYFKG